MTVTHTERSYGVTVKPSTPLSNVTPFCRVTSLVKRRSYVLRQVFRISKSKGVLVPGEVDALHALQGRNTYDLRFTSDVARQTGDTLLSNVEGMTVTPYQRSEWVTLIHVALEVRQEVVTVLGRFGAVKMCSYAQAPGILNGNRQIRIDLKRTFPPSCLLQGKKPTCGIPVSPVPASGVGRPGTKPRLPE
ncbi:putative zinc finger CCHC domain-containing protein 3-like [Apostichopus japonicus]|uniref:Putative zinc finger CCHC domain-containing protein 3-like n=1 Tax=Stichopus japonicus TaxID=307972 RepID=A0A2G8K771_STIJA|nr:putative zinc finger CCHC domain-containing protein 3-like [Apostichopus japonicus]